MVGMRDVAKKAGVSLSTVSLVVNASGYVSQDMRRRVEQAMRELDYIPNELARNLYRGRTGMIGVIVPTLRHPFFATLVSALQGRLAKHELQTLLCSTADADTGDVNSPQGPAAPLVHLFGHQYVNVTTFAAAVRWQYSARQSSGETNQ